MEERFRERIVGKFYTVEDLMDLPAAGMVNPAKAREARRMRRACGGAFGREDIKSKDLMHFGTSKIPRPEAVA